MRGEAGMVVGVDTGGTFTDVFASTGAVVKVPSTPSNPVLAIVDGLRRTGIGPGDAVAHGTTVATNAVLERKGARTALLTTAGFEDVLEIRRQNRPKLYDLLARWPEPLVPRERRYGVVERLDYRGEVLTQLDVGSLAATVDRVAQANPESIAVCLLFSYVNSDHEEAVGRVLCESLPDLPLSLSHEIAPRYGEFERTSTTVVNAYVTPIMQRYLRLLATELKDLGVETVHVMHSSGGLLSAASAADRPVQTILSGPAAGVLGARAIAQAAGEDQIITFDMGGTSTDVAVVPGEILEESDGEVATFPLLLPMLTIETVGAGGGSIARVDAGGALHVGPESAGAEPGPAAYGVGTQPTVTDANLALGRLGSLGLLGGAMALDAERSRTSLRAVADPLGLTVEQAAWAVIRLAISNMERAVVSVTLQRGYDPRPFTLVAFGGAGPLHAAELAEGLGTTRVLVPPHPGVMAALGLTVPDIQRDLQRTVLLPLDSRTVDLLEEEFTQLETLAHVDMRAEDPKREPALLRSLDVRYKGQSFDLRLPFSGSAQSILDAFTQLYTERYGYATPERPVEIVNVRLRATLPRDVKPRLVPDWPEPDGRHEEREVWFGSSIGIEDLRPFPTQILWRPSLPPGTGVEGPAVLEQYDSATVVPPGWKVLVDDHFNLRLTRVKA